MPGGVASVNTASTPDSGFQELVRARYAGNPGAMTALGVRLFLGRDSPWSPIDGAALIEEAARQGDPEARRRLATLAAAGVGCGQSWPRAWDELARAADLGDSSAARQGSLLRDLGVRGAQDMADWVSCGRSRGEEVLREKPRLVLYRGLLAPALCSYLVERSIPRLARAQVYSARQSGLSSSATRTNESAIFYLIDTDLVLQMIRARTARTADVVNEALEPQQVLHYAVGEFFRRHVDFLRPSLPDYEQEIRFKGQRVKTCLVYLNDDYEGGETDFPHLGLKVRGGIGDALFFDNLRADGTGDMKTAHAGLPPTRGEKWLLSQWIRNKPQRPE